MSRSTTNTRTTSTRHVSHEHPPNHYRNHDTRNVDYSRFETARRELSTRGAYPPVRRRLPRLGKGYPLPLEYVKFVTQWCRHTGISIRYLSQACGLSPGTLSVTFSRRRHGKQFTVYGSTLDALERHTGIGVPELIGGAK